MEAMIEGGCACGDIRYVCDAKPITMFKCHCRDCQYATGGPFVAAILVPVQSFKFVKGTPTYYSTPSLRGGENIRSFCGRCGSRLTGGQRPEPWPYMGITASSLDEPRFYDPQVHYFVVHAQPWDLIKDSLPKHDLYPPLPPRSNSAPEQ